MMDLYFIMAGKFFSYFVVRISQSLSASDPNESHIHPSTYSSTLRTSSKSRRFFSILYWLSCFSNKLLNSGHSSCIVCGINWFGLILTIPYQVIMKWITSPPPLFFLKGTKRSQFTVHYKNKLKRGSSAMRSTFRYDINNAISLGFCCWHKNISVQVPLNYLSGLVRSFYITSGYVIAKHRYVFRFVMKICSRSVIIGTSRLVDHNPSVR